AIFGHDSPPLCRSSASYQRAGMAGNHQVLVGLYHISADPTGRRADALLAFALGRLIELEPQPSTGAADYAAHGGRILTDTGREDHAVEAAQRGRKRGDMAG